MSSTALLATANSALGLTVAPFSAAMNAANWHTNTRFSTNNVKSWQSPYVFDGVTASPDNTNNDSEGRWVTVSGNNPGDGYIVTEDGGHLWFWSDELLIWEDAGAIYGPTGATGPTGPAGAASAGAIGISWWLGV